MFNLVGPEKVLSKKRYLQTKNSEVLVQVSVFSMYLTDLYKIRVWGRCNTVVGQSDYVANLLS